MSAMILSIMTLLVSLTEFFLVRLCNFNLWSKSNMVEKTHYPGHHIASIFSLNYFFSHRLSFISRFSCPPIRDCLIPTPEDEYPEEKWSSLCAKHWTWTWFEIFYLKFINLMRHTLQFQTSHGEYQYFGATNRIQT